MSVTLLIVGAASILVAVVVGGFVVRARLRSVRLLTDAVQHVVETRDFHPVTVHSATGEVATLASWFNRLLRMVARMRERQARLVLDAGHELRNPLTSLRANVDLLAVDLRNDRLTPDQRTEIVGDVQAQLGELSGLVTDLTHLARDEDEVRPQPVDVCEVVAAAVDRVRRRGQDRVFDVELQPLFLMGHADSLSRAVVNLLDNAVKWTPSGGTILVRLDGNRLRVSDEGPGIPEADLPYVFDRFFRGQTGRGTPGTGLGLAIVAKTVEDHGGTVRAGRSASGGAELTLQLPGVTSREALSSMVQGSGRVDAARSAEAAAVAAAAVTAAGVAERAVLAAADKATAAALDARRTRAAATSSAASVMAETVRQQASDVQDHAGSAAREVAAAAARAASRVAAAVLPGHEAEAREAAADVAQVTTEAASATAVETALAAAAATRAAAAAALDAAAAAEDAARLIDLEVFGTARAVQDTADAAATQVAAETQHAVGLTQS